MNNSDSMIHLRKFCQAQAETHGLCTELPHLKGNTSSLSDWKANCACSEGGRDGRNDKLHLQ